MRQAATASGRAIGMLRRPVATRARRLASGWAASGSGVGRGTMSIILPSAEMPSAISRGATATSWARSSARKWARGAGATSRVCSPATTARMRGSRELTGSS